MALKLGSTVISRSVDDTEARLAYLAERIDGGDLPGLAPSAPFDGEWRLGTISMSALAATHLAVRHPELRELHRRQVQRWAELLLTDEVRAYDTREWGNDALATLEGPDGHAGYLGHVVLAAAASCVLGNDVNPRAQALVDALARRIDESPTALIETYPAQTYVPDNVVVVAGIASFERCTGSTKHAATVARWLAHLRQHWVDPSTGVLVFAPGQAGRGSGAAWNALFLPLIDPEFAREQRAALEANFEVSWPLVGAGIREWPFGVDGSGDVDSGPLVFGLSGSATGFAMSAAAYDDDANRLSRLLATAEWVGTSVGLTHRRYAFAPLVGDAIVLANRTALDWSRAVAPSPAPLLTQ